MNTEGPSSWNPNRSWGNDGGGFRRRGGRGGRDNKKFWRGKPNFRGNQGNRGFRGGGGNRPDNFRNQNQDQWKMGEIKPKRESPGKRLSEDSIGVTEYVSDHEGFLGIIKSRYSDFQVAEINSCGEIAKLTNTSPPKPPAEEAIVEDEDLLISKYNVEILPTETWDRINALAISEPIKNNFVELDVTEVSKPQRTKIHDAVKKAFGESIVSSTVNIADKKLIRFEKYQKGVRIDNRVKWVWPGEYTHFVVHKENIDTMDAAARIAERLRLNVKPAMLGYAGTKDRRAKTSQWFSMRKVDPRKITDSCRGMREIRVGNFCFRQHHLRLGMLSGNLFRIVLRNVTASEETVNQACELLKENGFINYYGLQRFGTRVDQPTYQIGLKLLQGNLKEAIDCILEERPGPTQLALLAYRESGPSAALRAWPRHAPHHTNIELRLLKALAQCPTDLLGALDKLARNTRLLYLHSYQSLVWNRAVSERILRFGLKPAAGDIVPLDANIEEPSIDLDYDDNEDSKEGILESSSECEKDAQSSDETKPNGTIIKREPKKIPVKVLTQEDVESGKYSIFNIIMPLPGHTIEYPPNMRQFYEDTLTKDGLTMEMKHKYKSYTMSGAYRHMVVRPVNTSWRIVSYDEPHADLILSDWDEIEGRQLDGIVDGGKYNALLLTMTLPASCYATMALRELLKIDTASDNQALQNNYHKKKDAEPNKEDIEKVKEDNKEDIEKVKEDTKMEGEENVKVKSQPESSDIKQELVDNQEDIQAEKRKLESDSEEVEIKRVKEEADNQ